MNFIFLIIISFLLTQDNSFDRWNLEKLYSNQLKNKQINSQNHKNIIPSNNPIVFEEYIVGPGDEFFISFSVNDIVFSDYIVISQLNDIVIPGIGMINLENLSLKESNEKIKSIFAKKYTDSNLDITLTNVRKFYINIFGTNSGPTKILTNPLDKVSDVYEKIIKQINIKEDHNLTYRNILLKRKSVYYNIDLLEYKRLGTGNNPQLLEGDEIYLKNYTKYIDIYGGINSPGRYEFKENEKLADFIDVCGGYKNDIETEKIKISRFTKNKELPSEIIINIDNLDLFINEYDHIIIPEKDFSKKMVFINGEVKIPGYYFLEENMSVYELILKAGGYTDSANKNKIIINNDILGDIKDLELARINLIPPQNRSLSEISYLQSRSLIEKGSIISNNKEYTSEILAYNLNVDDKVYIPVLINYVEIIGAIEYPGRYPFIDGQSIADYITSAGGKTNKSRGNIYIVNSFNQKIKVSGKFTEIQNGETIFVETKENFNTWNKLKESMSLIGQLATLIAVIQSASN